MGALFESKETVLTWNTRRNDNDISAAERLLHPVILGQVTADFLLRLSTSPTPSMPHQATYRWCGDVREVSGHTRGVDHVVKRELVDESRRLEEEGQRLQGISTLPSL